MSPKPGSDFDPSLLAPDSAPALPPPGLLVLPPGGSLLAAPLSPVLWLPPLLAPPELPLPLLELLAPELPLLELLDPELPLLEEGVLGALAPPALGEDAPELEEGEGGVGTEGVVGVLAEGHPIRVSMVVTTAPAMSGRTAIWDAKRAVFINFISVAATSPLG